MRTLESWKAVCAVLLTVALAGCRPSGPTLRVEQHGEQKSAGPEVIQQIAPNAQVVSGEAAVSSEQKEQEAGARTAEDTTGAVAVKMKY